MALMIRDEELEGKLSEHAGKQPVPISKTALASYVLRHLCEVAEAEKVDIPTLVNRLGRRDFARRAAS